MSDKINEYALELWKLIALYPQPPQERFTCDTLQNNYIFSPNGRDEYLACITVISNTAYKINKIVFDYNIISTKEELESHYYFELEWNNNTPNIKTDFYEIVYKDGSIPMVNDHINQNKTFTELTIAKIVNEVNKKLK